MRLRRQSVFVLTLMLAACRGLPSTPQPAQVYDLGPGHQPRLETGLEGTVQVLAPSWLRTSAMQYRLSYGSASQRHGYLESRWAAPPAELVLGQLSRSLGGPGGCKLEIEIDEFIQDYVSASQSDGVIEARARLRSDGIPLANRTFALRVPAASPNAEGGVAALARGTRQLASELENWLGQLSQDAKIREACVRR
jgi:cholesterol transport system auxiliary component